MELLTSPFRYSRSKAKMCTFTLISSAFTSFLLRLLNSWKGRILFSSLSHATASASRTKDSVFGLIHCETGSTVRLQFPGLYHPIWYVDSFRRKRALLTFCICSMRSGYLTLISSEFLENTDNFPLL